MLVVCSFVMMAVLMLMILTLNRLYAFNQAQSLRRIASEGFEDILHPCITLSADADEKVAFSNSHDVRRSRFIGMHFCARFDQHTDIGCIPCDCTREIIAREAGADDNGILACSIPETTVFTNIGGEDRSFNTKPN